MRRIVIFGDSHVGTLQFGAQALSGYRQKHAPRVAFYSRHGVNWTDFTRTEVDGRPHYFADNVPGQTAVDFPLEDREALYFFSSPLHSAPIARAPVWQAFCPWVCVERRPELQAVSTAVIEAWLADFMACRFAMMRDARERGYKLIVVEPPKPLPRFAGLFGLRPDVVVAVDRIFRSYVGAWLREHGIPVVAAPPPSHADGLTVPEFASLHPQDPHHGNQAFGAEMLRLILGFEDQLS